VVKIKCIGSGEHCFPNTFSANGDMPKGFNAIALEDAGEGRDLLSFFTAGDIDDDEVTRA